MCVREEYLCFFSQACTICVLEKNIFVSSLRHVQYVFWRRISLFLVSGMYNVCFGEEYLCFLSQPYAMCVLEKNIFVSCLSHMQCMPRRRICLFFVWAMCSMYFREEYVFLGFFFVSFMYNLCFREENDGFVHNYLLGISYRHHTTNNEVKTRNENIGPYEDLLTSVKRRKLKWLVYVTRSSGLAKTVLQGTVQGGRRRGRQRKRWEDNIRE